MAASQGLRTFAVGGSADGVLRGGRRCARAVVRGLECVVLGEVREDGADGVGFFDGCDDAHLAAAVVAGFHVDAKHALEALPPASE